MPLPFDATLKDLVTSYAADFAAQFGLGDLKPLVPLNVDLSMLSAATDVALGHGDPPDLVVDLNFQTNAEDNLARRVLLYNAALHVRYRVPVHSIVVLLRRKADDAALTGKLHYRGRPRSGSMTFVYDVVRLWQRPVKEVLLGGLGALALAPLCLMPGGAPLETALPGVLERIIERLNQQTMPVDAAKILTGAYVLAGLRMTRDEARQLFRRVQAVRESTTYQAILDEGRVEEAQRILLKLLQGSDALGPLPPKVEAAVKEVTDLDRLERMCEKVRHVKSWKQLLAIQ
jgi:predicted transposase YdaD